MDNNQEKKEFMLIEKEDEINLNEEDLKKIAGDYYTGEGPACPYCGSKNTQYVNMFICSWDFRVPRISTDVMTA